MHVRRGLQGVLSLRGVQRGGHGQDAVRCRREHDTGETIDTVLVTRCLIYANPPPRGRRWPYHLVGQGVEVFCSKASLAPTSAGLALECIGHMAHAG